MEILLVLWRTRRDMKNTNHSSVKFNVGANLESDLHNQQQKIECPQEMNRHKTAKAMEATWQKPHIRAFWRDVKFENNYVTRNNIEVHTFNGRTAFLINDKKLFLLILFWKEIKFDKNKAKLDWPQRFEPPTSMSQIAEK